MKHTDSRKPDCEDISNEEGFKPVHRDVDNSWRHGCRIEQVFEREADSTFWRVSYRQSTDGETNELRDGTAKLEQVEPYEVTVTKYRIIQ